MGSFAKRVSHDLVRYFQKVFCCVYYRAFLPKESLMTWREISSGLKRVEKSMKTKGVLLRVL